MTKSAVRAGLHAVLSCVATLVATPASTQATDRDVAEVLQRVSKRVEYWYSRAQAIVSTETVSIQPLRADMSPSEPARRLTFDLRVAWTPRTGGLPEATAVREMLSVNGRAPRKGDTAGCLDPKPVSPEPLGMLLPARLAESAFSRGGSSRVDGRPALTMTYRGVVVLPPAITWAADCVTVSLPGRSRGRVWVDADTYDVLRIDESLVGTFRFDVPREHIRRGAASSMVIERAESSIRYRRVDFRDPPETLMLPLSAETMTVMRGSGLQRVRISQAFSAHRRFLTETRIVN